MLMLVADKEGSISLGTAKLTQPACPEEIPPILPAANAAVGQGNLPIDDRLKVSVTVGIAALVTVLKCSRAPTQVRGLAACAPRFQVRQASWSELPKRGRCPACLDRYRLLR